jgi:hypothetical protein
VIPGKCSGAWPSSTTMGSAMSGFCCPYWREREREREREISTSEAWTVRRDRGVELDFDGTQATETETHSIFCQQIPDPDGGLRDALLLPEDNVRQVIAIAPARRGSANARMLVAAHQIRFAILQGFALNNVRHRGWHRTAVHQDKTVAHMHMHGRYVPRRGCHAFMCSRMVDIDVPMWLGLKIAWDAFCGFAGGEPRGFCYGGTAALPWRTYSPWKGAVWRYPQIL